jgi:hypothetical protein
MKRIFFPVLLLSAVFAASSLRAQLHGGSSYPLGALEYSLPVLTAMPPVSDSMPSGIITDYLWADELMRTTTSSSITKYIYSLGYGDTLKYLAELLYTVDDNNPLSFYQWEISGWPIGGHPDYPWHYKATPAQERIPLENKVGYTFPDTGKAGFLLSCDIIADVSVSDTIISTFPGSLLPNMVLVNSTINDEIKGQKIPLCIGYDLHTRGKGKITTLSGSVTPWSTYAVPADTGSCLMFEYSPEWQSGIFTDAPSPLTPVLSNSTGWWIKPGGEYIVFLYVHGVNGDTSNGYFTIDPFWGVFGTQGAMYRVVSGHVVDPNDDFGLGASVSGGLTVSDWKTRLRARIYNILHP